MMVSGPEHTQIFAKVANTILRNTIIGSEAKDQQNIERPI